MTNACSRKQHTGAVYWLKKVLKLLHMTFRRDILSFNKKSLCW